MIVQPLKIFRLGALCLTLYVSTYLSFSFFGGYELYKSGEVYQFHLPTWDTWLWQPRFGRYDPFFGGTNALGFLFSPLIQLDQKFWHPNRPYFERKQDGTLAELPPPDEALLHPIFRSNMKTVLEYAKRIKVALKNHDAAQADKLFDEMAAQMQR